MVEPQNPSIALSVAGILPQLSAAAKRLAQQHGSNVSGLLSATMTGMLELVAEAESRKILSDDNIEPAVSTNMS